MNYWGNIFSSQKVTLALKNKSPNHIPERLQFACSLPPNSESGLVYRSELRSQCLQRGPHALWTGSSGSRTSLRRPGPHSSLTVGNTRPKSPGLLSEPGTRRYDAFPVTVAEGPINHCWLIPQAFNPASRRVVCKDRLWKSIRCRRKDLRVFHSEGEGGF